MNNARGYTNNFRPPRPVNPKYMRTNGNAWNNRNQWPRPPAMLSENLLLPASQQPPPMFGPRGATIPPRFYRYPMNSNGFNNQDSQNCDENYWCETCDRGFRSAMLLDNHNTNEHQKCNIDGCTFVAHPKVITKHIQMQHSSGLYSKISKLNDPEEIKKWREERRKKFPTKSNIEQKKIETIEKVERGERMGLIKKRFPENSNNTDNKNKFIKKKPGTRRRLKKTEKLCPEIKPKHNLPPFTGIRQLIMEHDSKEKDDTYVQDCNFIIEDEIEDESVIEAQDSDIPISDNVCGAINKLMADYKSSSEDESEPNNQSETSNSIGKIKIETNHVSNLLESKFKETNSFDVVECNDSDEPEEVKIVKIQDDISTNYSVTQNPALTNRTDKKSEKSFHQKPDKIRRMNQNMKKKLPSTLLQRLLAGEIKHERNIILQCVRHIVKNNYFDTKK